MSERNGFDTILMRIKDSLLIGGTVFGIFVFIFRFQTLPDAVAEHTIRLKELQSSDGSQQLKIQSIEQDLDYIKDTLNEIKDILKRKLLQ